ncbi:DNA polymerase [Paenibacillus sp. D2_2]|uniref:DNA polymerase n=1 Tax=Paenibacillus sp. D2_2 TaxID=3073092 RepID=UPI0028159CD0|nr:DNA polymerase [Paenibacillus sp. D2_2]WMT39258.1 DNA polymerase [Paenibacillus sp. D2_2]
MSLEVLEDPKRKRTRLKTKALEETGAIEVTDLFEIREAQTEQKRTRTRADLTEKSVAKKITKKEQQIIDLANNTVLPDYYHIVWTADELGDMCRWLRFQSVIAVDTETMGVNPFVDEIVGISVYAPHRGYYLPLKHTEETCLPREFVADMLRPIFEDRRIKFLLHNAKFDMHVLWNWMQIRLMPWFDTMIGQAILDENQSKSLKDMASYYLKVDADKFSTLFSKITFDNIPIKLDPYTQTGCLAGYYAIKDTELTYRMAEFQGRALNRGNLKKLFNLFFKIEMPFLDIVWKAEQAGVLLDCEYLVEKIAKDLHNELELLRQKIWAYTGEINLNSSVQLSEALYIKLGLPKINRDKPMSTDKKTLKKLKKAHKVVGLLLEFREKVKLTTAFADKLPKSLANGRVHTSFNPVGTKTGRMSCNAPNLQQIPSKVGGLIRNAFISDEGRLLASIDFSQQELRVLAHVSQDETLLKIYRDGLDVHSMTAVGIWDRKDNQVTYEDFEYCRGSKDLFLDPDGNLVEERLSDAEYIHKLFNEGKIRTKNPDSIRKDTELGIRYEKYRKDAKVVNFGIIYGMSEKGLAETLEITEAEAIEYIKGYFDAYPGVLKWMAKQRKMINEVHFSETMLGRKRRVYKEMQSGQKWLIGRGHRMGINAVIQGSSADMVKIASIKLQPLLEELDAKIVMWVHDEIIFDVPENIGMDNLRRIADIMCNALSLDCGLRSDIEVGKKWGQKMSEDDLSMFLDEEDMTCTDSEVEYE